MRVKLGLRDDVIAACDHADMGSELWQRLRAARDHAKVSQQQIADDCGIERASVSQWEARDPDKRNTPGVARLRAYVKLTGAPLEWLLNDSVDIDGLWADALGAPDPHDLEAPRRDAVEIPTISSRRATRVSEYAGPGYKDKRAGSLLFRPGSLESRGINVQFAEVHYATDNAMAPRICRGDAVLVDVSPADIVDGKLYLITWLDQEQVRLLYRELDGSLKIAATSNSPEYRERTASLGDDGFAVIGRVRWIGSWED